MNTLLHESHVHGLPLLRRGKVRDIYGVGENELLIVATDRLSAFDVVLSDAIPGKGALLTAISAFWFSKTRKFVANHMVNRPLEHILTDRDDLALTRGRSMLVKRVHALPFEAIVRAYLAGSGWDEYRKSGTIAGQSMPSGLAMSQRLPSPMFTPATKAQPGEHDVNITFEQMADMLGFDIADRIRTVSLQVYEFAAAYARKRGIIIADTKFEFGLDDDGTLILIDEVLTPDSSRFWPVDEYRVGVHPPSFDKQFVRDYLESTTWDKLPPAPRLPEDVIVRTEEKYREVQRRLTM